MVASNPFETVLKIADGYIVPRCLHVVADLGVADALDEAPRRATALALDCGVDPDALGRMLRLLVAHGVFESDGDAFWHSPASRLLRADHPQSLRDLARMMGLSIFWATIGELERSIRTGLPAVESVCPDGFWAHMAQHPADGQVFNAAMVAKGHFFVASILASYDFSGFQTIGDIGGGSGQLLHAILDTTPDVSGILFDLPHVIKEASAHGVRDRLTLQAGDFFRDSLPVCDCYVLMEILHDWPDAEAVAILQAIRRVASPDATILVIESIVPDEPGPDRAKTLDILMLALFGSSQRTLAEYERLLNQAGFELTTDIDTGAGISILEARPC